MIELRKLTKIYHSDAEGAIGLKNISIKFPEVGFVALTGQSGSGKTTMLMVLSGFQSYEEGDMFIDGVDALSYQEEDWQAYQKKDIGFIFQDYGLLESYTVIDNVVITLELIGLSEKEAKDRAMHYLKVVHLDDLVNQRVVTLSSGQKQRLAIARAIAKEPKIILCDEPTANLDPENSVEIMQILGEISKKCLVITSTHNYEDAKGYANYFIRLYKGSLISYEEVNKPNATLQEVKDLKKPNPFFVFKTYLKNRKLRFFFSNLLITLLFIVMLVMLSVFMYNLDDANTKVLSKAVFNNINDNELIVMKNSGEDITDADLDSFTHIKHVTAYEKYGLATDMNYYYRENVDYRYDRKIVPVQGLGQELHYENIEVFNKFNKSLYIKSYLGKITENDLASGNLPQDMFEVVASSEYSIGDTIKVYFDNPATIGANEFFMEFNVVGLLKQKSDDLYFSLDFALQADYLQRVAFKNNCFLYIFFDYQYYPGAAFFQKNVTKIFIPLYNGLTEEAKVKFTKSYIDSYTGETGFPLKNITSCLVEEYNDYKVAYVSKDVTYDIPLDTEDGLSSRFLIVSKDIYDLLIQGYTPQYAKIYVDEYPYVNDVIKQLTKNGYNVMSPYRASSVEFDDDKVAQRSNALIISITTIIVASLLLFAFYLIVMQMKKKEARIMLYQGASKTLLNNLNFIDLLSSFVISLIISISVYLLFKNFNAYLKEAYKYVRFYHLLIIIGLSLVITLASLMFHRRYLSYSKAKGGE